MDKLVSLLPHLENIYSDENYVIYGITFGNICIM